MNVHVLIGTYGEEAWHDLAWSRAYPSAMEQAETSVFHDPEGTIASVRNELARFSKAEWLCFLDADDELAPGFIEAMQRALRREGDGPLLLTPAVSYVHNGRPRSPIFPPGDDLTNDNFLVVGTLVQRELFKQVGGFEDLPHGFEDWSLWAKCWKAGARIVQVRRAVYVAHVNPDSKHRRAWRDRAWQVEMHNKVRAELFG